MWLLLVATIAVSGADDDDDAWDVQTLRGDVHSASLELTEGTWMSVSVHGEQLVFDLLGDLWSLPLAGGEATRLTEGPAWDVQPVISPDGARIAFTSDRGGNEQTWVMGIDGSEPRQVTDEKVARVTDPVWDPSGDWLIVRRRTIDTRSIGVTELWQVHLDGGAGFALTSLDDHPHAGEATTDGEHIWFSSRRGRFEYNHDPSGGLWRVNRIHRETGAELPILWGPGSASRPTLAPDGRRLAVVTRDRTKTLLELVDLETGDRRVVADWLDRDEKEGFALHGTYPRIDWTDDGDLVLWSDGGLWRVDVRDGSRTAIPFHAVGEWSFREPHRWARTPGDEVTARMVRWPTYRADGALAFSAMGRLWLRQLDGQIDPISEGTGYAPAWSPDGKSLAWTAWSDADGGSLHVRRGRRDEVLPVRGQLVNPAWSADGDELLVLRGQHGSLNPDLAAIRWFEVVRLTRGRRGWSSEVVTTMGTRGRSPRLFAHDDRIWFVEDRSTKSRHPGETLLVSVSREGVDRREHMVLGGAVEAVPSPDFKWVAWKDGHQVHVAPLPSASQTVDADGAVPTWTVSRVQGDWLGWTPDSTKLHWAEGPVIKQIELARIQDDAPEERGVFDDLPAVTATPVGLTVPRAVPTGTLALTHARVLTMNGDEALEDVTIVIEGDRITSVGGPVPEGAEVRDLTGKTVMPGIIDVHAHLHFTADDILPEQEWRYQTSLDFGVTTVHDPSASSTTVFTQAEAVAAGFMVGPRVYSTGTILYGALGNFAAETPSIDDARRHVRRLKDLGAGSVKVYQQSQRERRQWYAAACDEEEILCVAEGGGDLWMDLSLFADGFHALEHALPSAPVYADVKDFLAAARGEQPVGTAYTPTLLVAYGGLSGEHFFYQNHDPLDDARLYRHAPRRVLDARQWRRGVLAREGDWNHQQVARDAAELSRRGVTVTLGAHGQLQGLGAHWELWGLAGPGAMTPMEALRAATIQGARYLGMEAELGTVEAGKLADLVVLNSDPREDIHRSTDIHFVVANGQIRAETPSDSAAQEGR